jgi:chemosensory pili system protein ChpA (sensor histidine kinase/response regulator)
LGLHSRGEGAERPAIVVHAGGLRYVLVVDEILDIEEIVIRSLGGFLDGLEVFSGATITGDGQVILLLDALGIHALSNAPAEAIAPTVGANISTGLARQKPRVLLVDDSLSVRKVLGDMLERDGYEVTLAKDGLHATEILRTERFSALITDLEMPRLSGYELIEDLRRRHGRKELPVFVITTRAGQKHLDMARRLGANGFFTKPIDDHALLTQLRESLAVNSRIGGTGRQNLRPIDV